MTIVATAGYARFPAILSFSDTTGFAERARTGQCAKRGGIADVPAQLLVYVCVCPEEDVDTQYRGSNGTEASVTRTTLESVADKQVLYLTAIGRRTGLPREIEIWFVVCCERFYLIAETGEAAGWVKNIRRNPTVTVRIGEWQIDATARVLDRHTIANCGIRLLQSPIANMDGAMGYRWK
jgi:deazaflavin-dependent oxidoreductase (nitroreductase family)